MLEIYYNSLPINLLTSKYEQYITLITTEVAAVVEKNVLTSFDPQGGWNHNGHCVIAIHVSE